MAKRFTDTDKWKKPFIRGMKAPYKLLWLYILDECDHAGVWQVDLDVAQIKIGEKLNYETAVKFFKDKIIEIDGGEKWFIYDFIDFQYGVLNPENRAHNSVIQILTKFKINYENKPLTSPLQGGKDMVKDTDKDKELDKDKDKKGPKLIFPFDSKNFMDVWKVLSEMKKWKQKSHAALQACLMQLGKHTEADAIQMMLNSIAGEWQGLFELKKDTNGQSKQSIIDNNNQVTANFLAGIKNS